MAGKKKVVKSKYSKEFEMEIDELLDKARDALIDSWNEISVVIDSWKSRTRRTTETHMRSVLNNNIYASLRLTIAYYIIDKENRKRRK